MDVCHCWRQLADWACIVHAKPGRRKNDAVNLRAARGSVNSTNVCTEKVYTIYSLKGGGVGEFVAVLCRRGNFTCSPFANSLYFIYISPNRTANAAESEREKRCNAQRNCSKRKDTTTCTRVIVERHVRTHFATCAPHDLRICAAKSRVWGAHSPQMKWKPHTRHVRRRSKCGTYTMDWKRSAFFTSLCCTLR